MRSINSAISNDLEQTLNPIIKVTPLFDAEYLTNGYRYGRSYYRRQIGNRTEAFKIRRKMYKIELYLQWPTNRKSHMVYRTASFSMTLSDV